MGVGAPMQWWLQEFGEVCHAYWGEVAYHVGSSLAKKDGWRDVDVRLMLDDEAYAREFHCDPAREHDNPKWVAATLAWSALGRQMTGLPIDFQVQQRTRANAEFPHHRNALLRHHSHEIFGTGVQPMSPPPRADALDAGPVEEAIHQIAEAIRTPVHSEATQDGDHFTHRLSVGDDARDAPPKDKVKE